MSAISIKKTPDKAATVAVKIDTTDNVSATQADGRGSTSHAGIVDTVRNLISLKPLLHAHESAVTITSDSSAVNTAQPETVRIAPVHSNSLGVPPMSLTLLLKLVSMIPTVVGDITTLEERLKTDTTLASEVQDILKACATVADLVAAGL